LKNKDMIKKTNETNTYQSAWDELQQIVQALQDGEIGVDDLSAQIERAAELVMFCRERLRKTEEAVSRLSQ